MGETEVCSFLTHLAVNRNVAASTQNQALNALVFTYKVVLNRPLGEIVGAVRAKKPQKLPIVLTQVEVKLVLSLIVFVPMAGALLLLWVQRDLQVKRLALLVTSLDLLLAITLLVHFDPTTHLMQFGEKIEWIPALGIHYTLGVDGISVLFVFLSAFGLLQYCPRGFCASGSGSRWSERCGQRYALPADLQFYEPGYFFYHHHAAPGYSYG